MIILIILLIIILAIVIWGGVTSWRFIGKREEYYKNDLEFYLVSIERSITQQGDSLFSLDNEASYQWIELNNNNVILNDTNQSFTLTEEGIYAVVLTKDGCTDTSNCYFESGTNIPPTFIDEINSDNTTMNNQIIVKDEFEIKETFNTNLITETHKCKFCGKTFDEDNDLFEHYIDVHKVRDLKFAVMT